MQFLAHCHTHRITPSIVNIFYFLHCCDRCFVLMMTKNRRPCSFSSPARWLWHTTCSFLTCHEKIHIQFFLSTSYPSPSGPMSGQQWMICGSWHSCGTVILSQHGYFICAILVSLYFLSLFSTLQRERYCIFKDTIRDRGSVYTVYTVQLLYTAQCVFCKVYFSAQPNNLKLILNFKKYYPIEHIFVPACSSARKEHFFKF